MHLYANGVKSVNVKSMLQKFIKKHGLVGFEVEFLVLYLYEITEQNLYDKYLLADS